MSNAPPVVFPVGRFAGESFIKASLAGLGAFGLLWWQDQANLSGPWAFAVWACWCVCAALAWAWKSGQSLGSGTLLWTAERWLWQDAKRATLEGGPRLSAEPQWVRLTVLLDVGQVMLLTVQPLSETGQGAGRLRHAWVQKASMPSKWHGFRCAVYCRPKALPDAAGPWRVRS